MTTQKGRPDARAADQEKTTTQAERSANPCPCAFRPRRPAVDLAGPWLVAARSAAVAVSAVLGHPVMLCGFDDRAFYLCLKADCRRHGGGLVVSGGRR